MNPHIASAILGMGEQSLDQADIKSLASLICSIEKFRLLKISTLLAFFHKLKCGEFEFYGKLTPHKIMQALNKCYPQLMERQYQAEKKAEAERKEIEESKKEHITWAEYCRREGIETNNPLSEFFNRIGKQT